MFKNGFCKCLQSRQSVCRMEQVNRKPLLLTHDDSCSGFADVFRLTKALYADHVINDGVYLGLVDIAILAASREKDVLLMVYDNETEGSPTVRSLSSYFTGLDGRVQLAGEENPSIHSPSAWVFAACHNSFKRVEFTRLNHYMPLYPRSQLNEEWDPMISKLVKQLDAAIARTRDHWNEMQFVDAIMAQSLAQHVERLERKKVFYQESFQLGLMPAEVPGDGNCALWNMLAVQAGCFVQSTLSTKERVQELRMAPWFVWKGLLFCRGLGGAKSFCSFFF